MIAAYSAGTSDMLLIHNDPRNPRDILRTNYWEFDVSRQYYFVSYVSGTFRLLMPSLRDADLQEMRAASRVEIIRGAWDEFGLEDSLDIIWHDETPYPFRVRIPDAQFFGVPCQIRIEVGLSLTAWSSSGKLASWPVRYSCSVPEEVQLPADLLASGAF